MKVVLSFVFVIMCAPLFAKTVSDESGERLPAFRITSSTVDKRLAEKQCRVIIDFNFGADAESMEGTIIYTSINGLLGYVEYTPGRKLTQDLTPGKYSFKIWGGPGYEEIISDSIEFKAQTVNEAVAEMTFAQAQIELLKPALYFHSDTERNFSLEVLPTHRFLFTYPEITNGWKGQVHTNGSLTIDDKNYPYLFWEAEQKYAFKPSSNGYHLKKEEYVVFLEKKCDELGFNANEKTDFITFWGMRMQKHDEMFVQFLFDESCDQFATLKFEEQPDVVRRVYIMISPWNNYFEPYLKDQEFEAMPEVGYSVLEWGGYEFEITENTFTANN